MLQVVALNDKSAVVQVGSMRVDCLTRGHLAQTQITLTLTTLDSSPPTSAGAERQTALWEDPRPNEDNTSAGHSPSRNEKREGSGANLEPSPGGAAVCDDGTDKAIVGCGTTAVANNDSRPTGGRNNCGTGTESGTRDKQIGSEKNVEAEVIVILPPGSGTVCGYGVDIGGVLVDAIVVEKDKARVAYETEMREQTTAASVAEHVSGNVFRVKLGIPPKGKRLVQILIASELIEEQDLITYSCPLLPPSTQALQLFDINMNVELDTNLYQPPILGPSPFFDSFSFFFAGNSVFQFRSTQENVLPPPTLAFTATRKHSMEQHALVSCECFQNGQETTFFYVKGEIPSDLGPSSMQLNKIVIIWDHSLSRRDTDHSRELQFLQALLNEAPCANFWLYFLSTYISVPSYHKSAESLFSALKTVLYEGATNFSCLQLLPQESNTLCLLFSDGFNTWGSMREQLQLRSRIFTVSSDLTVDVTFLKLISHETGASFLDLRSNYAEHLIQHIFHDPLMLLECHFQPGVPHVEVFPPIPFVVSPSNTFVLTGKFPALEPVILSLTFGHISSGTKFIKKIALQPTEHQDTLVSRFWALQKLEYLKEQPPSEAVRQQMIHLAKDFHIVTPNSSLLVLENLEQYLEHEIEPPSSFTHLRDQYLLQIPMHKVRKERNLQEKLNNNICMWKRRCDWWDALFSCDKSKQPLILHFLRVDCDQSDKWGSPDIGANFVSSTSPPAPIPRTQSQDENLLMPDTDLYSRLGLSKGDTQDMIKKAYRKKAIRWHPDKNPNDPTAYEKFRAIGKAYDILSDPEKRKIYDTHGMKGIDELYTSHCNAEDIFSNFFGGASDFTCYGGRGGRNPSYPSSAFVEAISETGAGHGIAPKFTTVTPQVSETPLSRKSESAIDPKSVENASSCAETPLKSNEAVHSSPSPSAKVISPVVRPSKNLAPRKSQRTPSPLLPSISPAELVGFESLAVQPHDDLDSPSCAVRLLPSICSAPLALLSEVEIQGLFEKVRYDCENSTALGNVEFIGDRAIKLIVTGPPYSPYERGLFDVLLERSYLGSLQARFFTRIFHPCIRPNGVLGGKLGYSLRSCRSFSVTTFLHDLAEELSTPSVDCPYLLRKDAFEFLNNDQVAFTHKARDWTSLYAQGSSGVQKSLKGPTVLVCKTTREKPLQINDAEEAAKHYTDILREGPFTLECFVSLTLQNVGFPQVAARIISNISDLTLNNSCYLRAAASLCEQIQLWKEAIFLYETVMELRPEEPQSYRDLALALISMSRSKENYTRAIFLLTQVLEKEWDVRFAQVEVVALMDLNSIWKHISDTPPCNINAEYVEHHLPVDIRVVLTWHMDLTDVDLIVETPSGERCTPFCNQTSSGEILSEDFTRGYGPVEFLVKNATAGKYTILAELIYVPQPDTPVVCTAHIWTHYGTPGKETLHVANTLLKQTRVPISIAHVTIPGAPHSVE
ncbi:YfaP family protein [Pelomyxa schiedti]|nr:YfaP family protein [Pelomyxa schiedti]